MTALLEVEDLRAGLAGMPILRGISFNVQEGEIIGLIGESGSGKTMTGLALLRLLPPQIATRTGRLFLRGQNLAEMPAAEFQKLRGGTLGMVFQDPTGAFNPAKTIGWHFQAVSRRAGDFGGLAAAERHLHDVDISDASSVLRRYPHQLSGGMLQRALIALVVASRPALVVADEPTTNLDNIVERQIVALFARLREHMGAAILFITHDILLARELCDRIAVMYAGQIVEIGPALRVLDAPLHPYTRALIAASAELTQRPPRLSEITGEPPQLAAIGDACSFAPRCALALPECRARDPGLRRNDQRQVRCVLVPSEETVL